MWKWEVVFYYCADLPGPVFSFDFFGNQIEWSVQGHNNKQQSQDFPVSAFLFCPLYCVTSTFLKTGNESNVKILWHLIIIEMPS